MELISVPLEIPENANVILGQSHFIKTVEDLYEAIVNTVPQARFGIAFCEASGACLIRVEGNDEDLKAAADPQRPGRRRGPHLRHLRARGLPHQPADAH